MVQARVDTENGRPKLWYLTLHRWVGDRHEAINTSLDDHLAWMREQQLAGKVLFSDPISTIAHTSIGSVLMNPPIPV